MNTNSKPQRHYFTHFAVAATALIVIYSSGTLFGQNSLTDEILDLADKKKGLEFTASDMPSTPSPFLSLLPPGVKCDYRGWQDYYLRREQHARLTGNSLQDRSSRTSAFLTERERRPGQNDTQSSGQKVLNFGTSSGNNRVLIKGLSGTEDASIEYTPALGSEDDGSIPLANVSNIQAAFLGESYAGVIGDGPVEGLSDFDFYQVTGLTGQTILIEVITPEPFLDLDPFLSIFDENGVLLAFNDDAGPNSFDSSLRFELPADGSYFICVGGFGAFIPANPFDSQSGSITGDLGSEGEYDVLFSFVEISSDVDFFVFQLKKGDVFAAGIESKLPGTVLTVHNPAEQLLIQSTLNSSFYPFPSPISLAGTSSIYHIAEEDGFFAIAVFGNFGAYELELVVARPGLETTGRTQVIFLDYDGALFDLNAFFGIPGSDIRTLSPFKDFLDAWGLPDNDENVRKITSRITQVVRESLDRDLRRSGGNPNFDVVVIDNHEVNSGQALLTSASPGIGQTSLQSKSGFPVSRVIVGGTIAESGISTIGIAQSIDPGNYANEEIALVLLDVLSGPELGDPLLSFSLNDVALAPGTSKAELVATGVGNIISHEIGHFIGNWHTDGFDNIQTLMDEGPGGIFNLIGVGSTGVFGDNETIDVDFITDNYSTLELFFGIENTQNQSAFGLSSGASGRTAQFLTQLNLSRGLTLSQTYPNPAAPNNQLPISFQVDESVPVQLQIQDLDGRRVALLYDGMVEANEQYSLDFHPSVFNLKKGIYIYRLSTPNGFITRKMFITE